MRPPAGGWRELSGDGAWLTVYGAPSPDARAPILEVHVRVRVYRPGP